jgi:hypothetical protein
MQPAFWYCKRWPSIWSMQYRGLSTCGPAAKTAEYSLRKETPLACRAFAVSHFSRKATMCFDNKSCKKKNMYRLCIAFAFKQGRSRLLENRTYWLSLGSSVRLACRFLMQASRMECSAGASAECPTALPIKTTDRTSRQLLRRSGLLLDNLQMYPPQTSTGQGSQPHSVCSAQSCDTIL